MATATTTHQSRWGYHPCDYQSFLKLKEAHKLLLDAIRRVRAWERWDNKDPQNRVDWEVIRDDSGRKIGKRPSGPRPEPLAPVFLRYRFSMPEIVRLQFAVQQAPNLYEAVLLAYQQARTPVASPSHVKPLILPHDLDEIVTALQRWKENC